MKYVFFGSPRFAATILKELIAKKNPPLLVVASPDRPTGRKQEVTSPETKLIAEEHGIPVYQPEKLSGDDFPSIAKNADLFVVAAYAKIIPQNILEIPRKGTVGIHPSLLPLFRGASPIQSSILSGSPQVGVTIYLMDKQVDHGPVLGVGPLKDYKPDIWNYQILEDHLAQLGADLYSEVAEKYLDGKIDPISQDDTKATMTRKFKTEDAMIKEGDLRQALSGEDEEKALLVLRTILAFQKEPGAWSVLENPLIIQEETLPPELRIKFLDAKKEGKKLLIRTYQIEGKNPRTIQN